MLRIFKICELIITVCLISAAVSHFFVLTDTFGIWTAILIGLVLVANAIWYIIRIQKAAETDRVTFKKFIGYVGIPTALSVMIIWGAGRYFQTADRWLSYKWDNLWVSPFTYSGLGWQDNCPRVFKGVEGKRGLIDETTICFSLSTPTRPGDDVCSVLVKIKSRRGWEILGIGAKASQPEKLVWDIKKQIESPTFHQHKIKELPCGDKILFICSVRQLSEGWLIPEIKDALSLSFSKADCTRRKGG